MSRSVCYERYLDNPYAQHRQYKRMIKLASKRYRKYTLCEYDAMVCVKRWLYESYGDLLKRRVDRAKAIRLFRRLYRKKHEFWRCILWFYHLPRSFCNEFLEKVIECSKYCCEYYESNITSFLTSFEIFQSEAVKTS